MKYLDIIKLKKLAKDTSKFSADIKHYVAEVTVKANELLETYTIRSEDRNSPFRGFEEILNSLKGFGTEKVKVHNIDYGQKPFIVFTDKKVTKLLGVLNPR